jgi:hypothetical protein
MAINERRDALHKFSVYRKTPGEITVDNCKPVVCTQIWVYECKMMSLLGIFNSLMVNAP